MTRTLQRQPWAACLVAGWAITFAAGCAPQELPESEWFQGGRVGPGGEDEDSAAAPGDAGGARRGGEQDTGAAVDDEADAALTGADGDAAGGNCSAELCDDGDPCTTDSCDSDGVCAHEVDDFVACDDGDPCTVDDYCYGGTCEAGEETGCADTTDGGSDVSGGDDDAGADGDAGGGPAGCTVAGDCDDGNPCTDDGCEPGTGCVYTPNGGACAGGQCVAGVCQPGFYATKIAAGSQHTCALDAKGAVWCWGNNQYGQLGDDSFDQKVAPVMVKGIGAGVAAISVGDYQTCAIGPGGAASCWGWNKDGQLGDGSKVSSPVPVPVMGLDAGVKAIAAGTGFTCAIDQTSAVRCWGYGQSPEGGPWLVSATPKLVAGIVAGGPLLAAGIGHACAVDTGGATMCWGRNYEAQIGGGSKATKPQPTTIAGLAANPLMLVAGNFHTCALTSPGAVVCWGSNAWGESGEGGNPKIPPGQVAGLAAGVQAVAAGAASKHNCAITPSGAARCWGWNNAGQLGDGTKSNSSAPKQVTGLSAGVQAVTAGGNHSCAIDASGRVACWGLNTSGQVGDGTKDSFKLAPVLVAAP